MKKVITLNELNFANTYIVKTEREAIIVDPACKLSKIQAAVGKTKVLGVFLTHGHYDHFSTLTQILEEYDVPCFLHPAAYKKLAESFNSYGHFFGDDGNHQFDEARVHFIEKEENIRLSPDFTIQVMLTPGHTNGSICFILDDMFFSGDTLFKGNVGRTDLASGNDLELQKSIKRLLEQNNNYVVYPGHDQPTTIEDERKNNYYYLNIK